MHNLYNRRQFIRYGFAGLAGLSVLELAGGSASTHAAAPRSSVALKMVFWGSTTRNTLTRAAIELFQKDYPGVTISSQFMGNDIYYTTLDKLIASGKTPDLIQMDMRYISGYVRKNQLLDLNQLIYNQIIDLTDFDPLLLTSSKVNNTVYGVPLGGNYQATYYDTVLLDRTGVGMFPANMTWDTFANYTAELSQASQYAVYGTSDNSGDITNFELWIRSRGKELYTLDGKLAFELADVADWYNYWNNLRQSRGCLPADVQINYDNTLSASDSSMIKGKAIFFTYYSNTFVSFQGATPHELALTTPPMNASTTGMYLKTSQMLSIAASTSYPQESANFLDYIINNSGAISALGIERGMPGSAKALALLNLKFNPVEQKIASYVDAVSKSGITRPKAVLDPPAAGQVATLLKQAAQNIGLGKTSVSDGAKVFFTAAQKALL